MTFPKLSPFPSFTFNDKKESNRTRHEKRETAVSSAREAYIKSWSKYQIWAMVDVAAWVCCMFEMANAVTVVEMHEILADDRQLPLMHPLVASPGHRKYTLPSMQRVT